MLTPKTLDAFALSDTRTIADALIHGSLIGTEIGDAVIAAVGNYPDRHAYLVAALTRRNAWESAK